MRDSGVGFGTGVTASGHPMKSQPDARYMKMSSAGISEIISISAP
jgi:hypothetical protein